MTKKPDHPDAPGYGLRELFGRDSVAASVTALLVRGGFDTVGKVARARDTDLLQIIGFGPAALDRTRATIPAENGSGVEVGQVWSTNRSSVVVTGIAGTEVTITAGGVRASHEVGTDEDAGPRIVTLAHLCKRYVLLCNPNGTPAQPWGQPAGAHRGAYSRWQ